MKFDSKAECKPPNSEWRQRSDGIPDMSTVFVVSVTERNQLLWDGTPINEHKLDENIQVVRSMNPQPFLLYLPDGSTDCDFVERVRKKLDESLHCSDGHCGEGNGWKRY
jgi:biopolymer transport protein ExbD